MQMKEAEALDFNGAFASFVSYICSVSSKRRDRRLFEMFYVGDILDLWEIEIDFLLYIKGEDT